MRLYDAFMVMRMIDMASRRRSQGRGLQQRKPVRPLTDKQIEKNYRKRTHRQRHVRILFRPVHNATPVMIGFLLLLVLFALLTVIVNTPLH